MISVSFLNSIYDKEKTIKLLNNIDDVSFIHVDLMDGLYVDEKNFEIDEIINLLQSSKKDLDIHLMTLNPEKYIKELVKLNPKCITFHPDAVEKPKDVINLIKSYNINVGLAINSFIDIDSYETLYGDIDTLLIMSVKAGYGGQKFLSSTYDKLEYINSIKNEYNFLVEIDGGVNKDIYMKLKEYNVDIFVIGSYICMNENFERPLKELIK